MKDFSIGDIAAKFRVGPFSIEINSKEEFEATPDADTNDLLRRRKEAQDIIDEIDRELREKGQ